MPHDFRLTEPRQIRAFLSLDRPRYAYMLGDLTPPYWSGAAFYGASDRSDAQTSLKAVVLHYTPLTPSPVITAGSAEGVAAILQMLAEDQALRELVYHAQTDHVAAVRRFYDTADLTAMWRMAIRPDMFNFKLRLDSTRRLTGSDAAAAQTVYNSGPLEEYMSGVPNITPQLLDNGVFYGSFEGEQLVALAGTHIVSASERIGAVGYVFTRPDARSKGHATRATAAVTRHLFTAGLDLVVLNVKQDNPPAIRAYQQIGYVQVSPLYEGHGRWRGLNG